MTLALGVTRGCTTFGDYRVVDLIDGLLVVGMVGLGIAAELEVIVGAGHTDGSGAHYGCWYCRNLIEIF